MVIGRSHIPGQGLFGGPKRRKRKKKSHIATTTATTSQSAPQRDGCGDDGNCTTFATKIKSPSGTYNFLAGISNKNLGKKCFSRSNPNGSVFFVNQLKDCFFVSVFLGLKYNMLEGQIRSMTQAQFKEAGHNYFKFLEQHPSTVHHQMVTFFALNGIDIKDYPSGSLQFMEVVAKTYSVQISIFDDHNSHDRILMYPEKYDPAEPQIYLLKTQYPIDSTKKHETQFAHHFHGLRNTCRGLVGHCRIFCPYCGKQYSYNSQGHQCKQSQAECCRVCTRPKVTRNEWLVFSNQSKVLFCPGQPDLIESSSPPPHIKCTSCSLSAVDTICLAYHQRSCNHVVCKKCFRRIKIHVGKYKDPKVLGKHGGHENCMEIFCHTCSDYFMGFDDLRHIEHVCFVKTLKKSPKYPNLATFDLETTTDSKVNAVGLVFEDGTTVHGKCFAEMDRAGSDITTMFDFKQSEPHFLNNSFPWPHLFSGHTTKMTTTGGVMDNLEVEKENLREVIYSVGFSGTQCTYIIHTFVVLCF